MMRLLKIEAGGTFSLVTCNRNDIPPYAILSHTWGADEEELTFKDLLEGTSHNKLGYRKLTFCGNQAARDGLTYFWIDTCCIDKTNSTELSEAINSMFKWYKESDRCYVYLSDVLANDLFRGGSVLSQALNRRLSKSIWFKRGWTLQELLAPTSIDFFSVDNLHLGTRTSLVHVINGITGIPSEALLGERPLSLFPVDMRLTWAKRRDTKLEEDFAYSMFGIFGVHIPIIYGEGREKALARLRREINVAAKEGARSHSPVRTTVYGACSGYRQTQDPPSMLQKRLENNQKSQTLRDLYLGLSGHASANRNGDEGMSAVSKLNTKTDPEELLYALARKRSKRLNWQSSIEDLLKLLGLRYDFSARERLAERLQVNAGATGSGEQNIGLHRAMMKELGSVKGTPSASLCECLKCGRLGHCSYQCH